MMTMYISPYRRLANLRETMDKLWDESMRENTPAEREMTLAVDVRANEDEFVVRAMVPGLEADNLDIEILKNTVAIRGEFKSEAGEEEPKFIACELPEGRFSRMISLPTEIDPTKAEANLKNGVLTLRVPKAEAHKPKSIKISVA